MEKNRLFWASRRGMLELDLLLMPFVEKIYPTLILDDQQRYQQLLEAEDPDLYAWLMGHKIPEDLDILRIVNIIRETRSQVR